LGAPCPLMTQSGHRVCIAAETMLIIAEAESGRYAADSI
jgi:hypothetical protein